jgi:hypothetical protein
MPRDAEHLNVAARDDQAPRLPRDACQRHLRRRGPGWEPDSDGGPLPPRVVLRVRIRDPVARLLDLRLLLARSRGARKFRV